MSDFIHSGLRACKGVLIHSFGGRNRAPVAVAQYLMAHQNMSRMYAAQLLRSMVPEMAVSQALERSLIVWEQRLLNQGRRYGGPKAPRTAQVRGPPKSAWQ